MALLDRARILTGQNIPPIYRNKILQYVSKPSVELWEEIYSIAVWKSKTVWRAVCDLEPRYLDAMLTSAFRNRVRWKEIPDGFTVARAIKKLLDSKEVIL